MRTEARQRLLDVLEACRAVGQFAQGKDFAAYQTDEMLRAAAECGMGLSAATAAADSASPSTVAASPAAIEEELSRAAARRRAALIKPVYEVDPLICPKCGGEMRVIAFIERRQRDVIRKILEHRGLWEEPRAATLDTRHPTPDSFANGGSTESRPTSKPRPL